MGVKKGNIHGYDKHVSSYIFESLTSTIKYMDEEITDFLKLFEINNGFDVLFFVVSRDSLPCGKTVWTKLKLSIHKNGTDYVTTLYRDIKGCESHTPSLFDRFVMRMNSCISDDIKYQMLDAISCWASAKMSEPLYDWSLCTGWRHTVNIYRIDR